MHQPTKMQLSINKYSIGLFVVLTIYCSSVFAAEINIGIAKTVITPKGPIYLTGYANREKPATGVIHDLWAKAIVFEETNGNKTVIVTTDLLGLSHDISTAVAKKVQQKFGISRAQLLLNSSHTHSGPMVWPCLSVIADYSPAEQQIVSNYSNGLVGVIVDLIDSAIHKLSPMEIAVGHGEADFAFNRRVPTDKGFVSGVNLKGPVDHDVPVIKITNKSGKVQAVLFGYACHNTTMVGDNYLVNGDYAGFAQIEIEKQYPGSTAMFVMGCAGDQNPSPRGNVQLAQQHGKSLAGAVFTVLNKNMQSIHSSIKTDFQWVDLAFKPVDIDSFKNDLVGTNKFLQRRAQLMMEAYNKGWDVSKYPYGVQAIRLGESFTLLALSGEVVVDYSLRTKKEYPKENLFVAGYCNEVMCYIPSKRILKEGGYEATLNMIYYGMPGPFAESIEENIFNTIHKVLKNVGVKK